MNRDTLLELIPAYALDALDESERQEVAVLLETDAEARQLLQDYLVVAEVLPLVVSVHQAPATTRTGLQQRLAERRANPTVSVEKSEAKTDAPKISKIRTLPPTWAGLGAVAVFILAIVGLVVVLNADRQTPEQRAAELVKQEYIRLVADATSRQIPVEPAVAGLYGDLVISSDGEKAILHLAELPQLNDNQAYQLWALDDVELQSAGLYHWKDGHGPYFVRLELAKPINQYQAFGMSIEPEAGSPDENAPSGEGIWRLELASSE